MSAERDAVLWRFIEEVGAASERLKEWTERYPEYAADLVGLSLYWDVVPEATSEERAEFSAAAALPDTAGSTARTMLRAMQHRHSARQVSSVVETARKRGLTPADLAARLRIGLSVLARIERRLLNPSSIPAKLINGIAEAIGVSPEAVLTYLREPPTLAAAASYRARHRPALRVAEQPPQRYGYVLNRARKLNSPEISTNLDTSDSGQMDSMAREKAADAARTEDIQQDFVTAVRTAPDMEDADKALWLADAGDNAAET